MTAENARQTSTVATPSFLAGLMAFLGDFGRGAGSILRKVLIAVVMIMGAGLIAVLTALLGLILAVIALVMRFAGRPSDFGISVGPRQNRDTGGTITLDARQTPRGWTVE